MRREDEYYDEPDDRALVAVPLMLLALPWTWPVWPYIFWRSVEKALER